MRKEKMNNKGFSLVELIIVIAIMAILVVILAPQYLRYVERSRNSTDYQNATSIVDALQIYVADPDAPSQFAANTITVTVQQGVPPVVAPADVAFNDAMANAGLDFNQIQCVSRTAWHSYQIQVVFGNDGQVTFSYQSDNAGGAAQDPFAQHMGTPAGLANP